MRRKKKRQAFAAWILAVSIVFGNSSFIVQAEEVATEDNVVAQGNVTEENAMKEIAPEETATEKTATEEDTTEEIAPEKDTVDSKEDKSQEEAEVSTEKAKKSDEMIISDEAKNEVGTMSGEEPTEQPGMENEGGENEECPFDFKYGYGSRDWSLLFTDTPLTLELTPSSGEKISKVEWEIKKYDKENEEEINEEATCAKRIDDGSNISSIKLQAVLGDENIGEWFLVRAKVSWGEEKSSSVETKIQVWEPEYDYYYPMAENVYLLRGWDFGIDNFEGWIFTAACPEGGAEVKVEITNITLTSQVQDGKGDVVTFNKRGDGSGWDLLANDFGDAVVTLSLEDSYKNIRDYSFNVHVSNDVYYMNWYYPEGIDQMLPNSDMKIENISMTHEYLDENGEYQSKPITDFELSVRDDESVTYDKNIIGVEVDNNSKSVTITSKKEGDTNIYLLGMNEKGEAYCGENIGVSVVEDYYGLYADKQCAKPGETITVEKFNPVVNYYSYSENKPNEKPVEGVKFEFGEIDESIGIKWPDGTITINPSAISEKDGPRSVRIPIYASWTAGNDSFELDCWAELVICNHTFIEKWNWSADFKSASLRVTCGKCGVYDASVTAKVTSNQIVAPTVSTVGKMEYTAEAVIDGKTYTDKKTADIPKLQAVQTVDKPAKTKVSSVKNVKGRKMTIKWKRNKKATGYQIQYSTDKNFTKGVKKVSIPKNKTVSKTVKKLKKGKYYYVRIRSYKKVSGGKNYSDWSSVKKVKIKK